jgi:hypothetical protein
LTFTVGSSQAAQWRFSPKDFIRAPQYYNYEDDTPVINLARLKNKETQLRQYCLDNQNLLLLEASEIFMDKKYHN